jgi:hypothetical protein
MLRQPLIIASVLCGLMWPVFAAGDEAKPYEPLTAPQRVRWYVKSVVGPASLAAGVASSGFETAINEPPEYGPHWEGFAKRYGMRLMMVTTGNGIEAGVGAAWGEDPRYFHAADKRFWSRVGQAARMTFVAYRSNGATAPAYARYTGIVGSNFLSNTWRVQSENSAGAAFTRIALGFAGKFASNVFEEFFKGRHR